MTEFECRAEDGMVLHNKDYLERVSELAMALKSGDIHKTLVSIKF